MTPKEKAENLVNQYRMILMNEDTECGNEILCTSIAIKSTLIAVDEILNVIPNNNGWQAKREYWQEVKQEINKL
jgi:hypothetical protein